MAVRATPTSPLGVPRSGSTHQDWAPWHRKNGVLCSFMPFPWPEEAWEHSERGLDNLAYLPVSLWWWWGWGRLSALPINWRTLEQFFPSMDLSHRVCHSGDMRKCHSWRMLKSRLGYVNLSPGISWDMCGEGGGLSDGTGGSATICTRLSCSFIFQGLPRNCRCHLGLPEGETFPFSLQAEPLCKVLSRKGFERQVYGPDH